MGPGRTQKAMSVWGGTNFVTEKQLEVVEVALGVTHRFDCKIRAVYVDA